VVRACGALRAASGAKNDEIEGKKTRGGLAQELKQKKA